MESRRFYTSPVNHRNVDAWPDLAAHLEAAVRDSSDAVSVELGQTPVFDYGSDARTALDAENRLPVSARHVRINLWSSIAFYETVCITFGSKITKREASTIVRRLEDSALAEQAFLREVGGEYDIDSGQVYGYAFEGRGGDEADREAIEWLLEPFDVPIYMGSRACVLDENGNVDREAFDVFREEKETVIFVVQTPEATTRLWSGAFESASPGLVAFFGGDPADTALLDRFGAHDDLRILLAEEPSSGMRVTLGRCHEDDALVVVYTPPEEPDIEQRLLFVI